MPVIFQGQPGRVVSLTDPGVPGQARLLNINPTMGFNTHRSIITRVTISQQGNFQFLHTLGSDIYIYVFGDRIGSITISGLSFASCTGPNVPHGIEAALSYYKTNRLASRNDQIEVIVGSTPIRGFLVGMNANLADPKDRIMAFHYSILALPEEIDAPEIEEVELAEPSSSAIDDTSTQPSQPPALPPISGPPTPFPF